MITRNAFLYMSSLALISAAMPARADDPQDGVTLGLGAQYAPRYSGSDSLRLQPVPVFQARKGAFFADAQKGIGYDLQTDNGIYLEHSLGYSLGRSDRDSDWRDGADRLKGMGSIRATANTALALGWSLTPWLIVEGKATLPLSDAQGVNYQASVTLVPLQGSTDTLAFSAAGLWGDARYINTWYGVSAAQSRRSGFRRYDAAGGFYGMTTNLSWSHQFDAHWGSLLSAGYTWLDAHAAESPLVAQRNQLSALAGFTYTF